MQQKLIRHPIIAPPVHQPRPDRVGIEIEFVGISARRAAQALERGFGGELGAEDPQAFHVADSALGDLRVELDIRHVHPYRGTANPLHALPAGVPIALGHALAPFAPRELIIGPLDRAGLALADKAVAVLRDAGARGKGATLFGSLGLHFNVEHADDDPLGIVSTFKAFLILEPWLRRETGQGVLARAHAPPPYPDHYVRQVLAPDYWPDLEVFTLDYLLANPTRKRSLDLLPLLLHHSPGRLPRPFAGKVKPRPAFHYRLPHAHVGRPGWTIGADWERWRAVERLAAEIRERDTPGGRGRVARTWTAAEGPAR